MHIGYFSTIVGTKGGPAIVDKRVIEAIAHYDRHNTYTIYGVTSDALKGLKIQGDNFRAKTIRPSGKWMAVPFGLSLELWRHPVDLLHATIFAPPIVPGRYVLTLTCWSQYSQPEFYPPPVRNRLLFLLNRGLRKATAVFCYTEFLKEKVIERFGLDPERVFITQPAVGDEMKPVMDRKALTRFLASVGIDRPYLLFIGTLTKRKNVTGLIKAYHELVQQSGIDQQLVLLGEKGYYHEEIFDLVNTLNLHSRVIFVERRPHHELPLFYSGADLFVFPTFSEGFGLPPLEAMACGIPVVASNATCVPEVVGDAAVLVDPHNSEEMAAGIQLCLTDQKVRQELISKGLERAAQFSWEKSAVQVVTAYEKVHQTDW